MKTEEIKKQLEEQYDKFADKAQEIFKDGTSKTKEAWDTAVESARKQMTDAGEFSAEQGKKFKDFLSRDLQQIYRHIQDAGEGAKDFFNPTRIGLGALSSLASLLDKADETLQSLREKTDKVLVFKTGEITSAGALTCINCKKVLNLKKTGHIPPCPGCSKTKFRKGF